MNHAGRGEVQNICISDQDIRSVLRWKRIWNQLNKSFYFCAVKKSFLLFCAVIQPLFSGAQSEGMVFRSSKDTSFWVRATAAVQVWTRYTDHNPGSAVNFGGQTNYTAPKPFDIGIRRARFQLFGNVGSRTFIYAQFGMNNFHANSQRKAGAFFHDLTADYEVIGKHLVTGGGLTGWSGLSRYAAPSIASTLMYDAPLFQQTTNDVSDQFLRKLSLYAKGKIGAFDYRVALSKPMPVQLASPSIDTALGGIANRSVFSPALPNLQAQGYFMWQFLQRENNTMPYTAGSYLGEKNVFNLGAGFIYQPEAMRHLDTRGQMAHTAMRLVAVDLYFDHVVNTLKKTAFTAYLGLFDFDFGPNHIRTLGVMNPANTSVNPQVQRYSGFGNAYAMFGTGQQLYLQAGYKLKDSLFNTAGTLQPFADLTYSSYQAFDQPVIVWNAGFNWLLNKHHSKISLNYQDRPVFTEDPSTLRGTSLRSARRGMAVLQYQAFF